MASIEPRNGKWRVKIRRIGHKPMTKTFLSREQAQRWATATEARLSAQPPIDKLLSERITLGKLLIRYQKEVTPHKRGANQERKRIQQWLKHPLARFPIGSVRSVGMAQFRDERLHEGASPNTVRLGLAVISHLFTVAKREWGYEMLRNRVQNIRKPTVTDTCAPVCRAT